jgi:PAS domain S-box-containing protein
MPAHTPPRPADLPFSEEGNEQMLASYRSLIENIPGIVYTAQLGATGRWLYVSPQVERILGWSAEEWCGDASIWFKRLHPEDRERALADEYVSRSSGDQLTSEYRLVARDGRVLWFQDRASIVYDDDGDAAYFHGVMLDITERKQAEADLSESRTRLAKAQEIAGLGNWEWCSVSKLFTLSSELREICGLDGHAQADFKAVMALVHPDDRERVLRLSEAGVRELRPFRFEMCIVRPDGAERSVELHADVEPAGDGGTRVLGTIQDVTERRSVQDALMRSHDQFQSVIDNSPSVISAKDRSFRYLFVNRAFGHMFGVDSETMAGQTDESILPLHVAGRTRHSDRRVLDTGEVIQEEDVVPHRDGDRTYLTQKFPLRDSAGEIYAVCAISTDITERKAREEELRTQFEWSVRVHDAVRHGQLIMYSQPIQDLRTGAIEQEELLVRMRGPGGRHLPPADFLPQAERFGLVTEIDRWVVGQAVKLATRRDGKVEVNLSGKSIGDNSLLELIEEHLRTQNVDPAKLVFEITETAAAENMEAAREFAWRLKSIGCGFALDDFGTGYGSFTYLKHLPVDFIKIDLQFVRYLSVDPSDRKVVKSITAVAKNFGVQTIAEGVEHSATLELLRELDVDHAQGFLIGEPRPLDA